MLSDLALVKWKVTLKVKSFSGLSNLETPKTLSAPSVKLEAGEKGYLLRSLHLQPEQPTYMTDNDYIYYIPQTFHRYYIDLQQTFDEYSSKFSSKTRSTIRRKIKNFSKNCDNNVHFKCYKSVDEINDFYSLAREVSKNSYQEKLLDAGLPEGRAFKNRLTDLATNNSVRGYLLFDGDKPIAYMYCPISNGTLVYQYLGYNPEYFKWSVGTILHWYAFQDIFNEGIYKYFDFTEGQSEHKRLYSTGSFFCGNVYIFPKSLQAWFLVASHSTVNSLSEKLGVWAEKIGIKAKLKKLLRFRSLK